MENNTNIENQETITMSKDDYAKAIQSAEDKLRTNYSKQIKNLQGQISKLTPTQKTQSEIDFENRLHALEAKEKKMQLYETLQSKNIDKSLADFLKDDVDIDKFSTAFENFVNNKITSAGYKPTGHASNETISKEKWQKMSYSEKQNFYNTNPELAKKLLGK